jgi:Fic family protein
MLHAKYWLCEYISLSKVLHKAPAAYARAFLHTETDDGDVTYFLLHQVRALRQATDDLKRYIERKQREVRETEGLLRKDGQLNHRQLALLAHALRHGDAAYTALAHGTSHDVVLATARSDLQDLADKRLLDKRKVGKQFVFRPVDGLRSRVARVGARRRH